MSEHEIDWQAIGAKLRAPFDPADVDFRAQLGKSSGPGDKVQAVHYIDARTVADRLDEAVGPGAWSFTYEPLVIERGEVQLAKGALAIHGVTKEDIGDASTFSESKGCVSDALKRAAVLWGIGRYLYSLPSEWITLDQRKQIPAGDVQRLRAKLPRPDLRPDGAQPQPPQQPAFVARPPVIHPTVDESAAKEPRRFATPDQWARLRKACELLSIEPPEAPLDYDRAENLLHEYMETWKRLSAQRQREGATR